MLALLVVLSLLFCLGPAAASAADGTAQPVGGRFADDPYDLLEGDFFDFAPPTPDVLELVQPDGTVVQARLNPMEVGGCLETLDGYTIVQNEDGWWVYAELGDGCLSSAGELVPSSLVVGEDVPYGLEKKLGLTPSIWLDASGNDIREEVFAAIHDISSPNNSIFTAGDPGTKVYRYVVLLVEFQDVKLDHPKEWFEERLSGLGTSPTGSVSDFYYENSYHRFLPLLDVYGPITSSYNMAWYDYQLAGGHNVAWMINNDIGPKVKDLINWDQYDNDRVVTSGYRTVDMVVVIHAGPGKEATGIPGQIWSHASTANFRTGCYGADGYELRIRACNTSPAVGFNIGVVGHEMGHSIGEPDYYATNYKSMGTGDWDMMAGGSWLGSNPAGSNPSHFNPHSKINQGWVTPQVITDTTLGIQLRPRALYPDIVQIPLGGSGSGSTGALERFYIEYVSNRVPGAIFDRAVPSSGILIWHYDAGGSQNNPARYRVALEEYDYRDGTQDLRLNFNRGEPTDPWVDTAIGMTPETSPNTSRNTPLGGTEYTGWNFVNISPIGPTMSLDIVKSGAMDRLAIDRPAFVTEPVIVGQGPAFITTTVFNNTADTLHDVSVQFWADLGGRQLLLSETLVPSVAPGVPTPVTAAWPEPFAGKFRVTAQACVGEEDTFVVCEEGVLRVFERPAPVLIVDDDDGYSAEEAYEGVLTSLGVPYVLVTHTASLSTLSQYQLVIWHAGQAGRQYGQLTKNEIADLKAYLNAGGKLWMNSPRLAAALAATGSAPGVDPDMLRDYFGAYYPMSCQDSGGSLLGLGHPIGGDGVYRMRPYPGRPIQDFLQPAVSLIGTATPLFKWSLGDYLGTEVIGDAAHNNFHVVYFGFCLSQIISGADRLLLAQQVLDRMGIPTVYFGDRTYLMQKAGAVKVFLHDPVAQSPQVVVTSEANPIGVQVNLEASDIPGTFIGVVNVQKTGSQGNVLQVNDVDTLRVSYLDTLGRMFWATAEIKLRVDKDLPATIHHDAIFSATDAEDLEVGAVVTDDIRVRRVDLFYRVAGSESFTPVRMAELSRSAYNAVIPAAAVTPLGVEYYITATDSKGNVSFRFVPSNPQFIAVQPRTLGK
ncbi:MAG: M6 family metalloprotease domain-containing protein [Acetobacteraceae bacterium]|nr:M6 family metalloprotease domain-containing protein [Acetobacteraceae bacterium]